MFICNCEIGNGMTLISAQAPEILRVRRVIDVIVMILYDVLCLTAFGFIPGGSSTVHIYTQTIHRTTQST
jgi:hypothetical protein